MDAVKLADDNAIRRCTNDNHAAHLFSNAHSALSWLAKNSRIYIYLKALLASLRLAPRLRCFTTRSRL